MSGEERWNPHWNYHLAGEPRSICACPDGMYEGARPMTWPRYCERCGGVAITPPADTASTGTSEWHCDSCGSDLAARVSAAATKARGEEAEKWQALSVEQGRSFVSDIELAKKIARAEERERIAQAIEATLPHEWAWPADREFAARIAREQAR